MQKICLIQTSVSSLSEAKIVATCLMRDHIAACVQISGPGVSFYRWKGELEQSEEYYLSIKTTSLHCRHVIEWLEQHHPYELPEIVWSKCSTTDAYGDWVHGAGKSADDQQSGST